MDRFDRIYQLHKLLAGARVPVSRQRIEQELECSKATAKRLIENLRDYQGAPITYDRERNGYFYDLRDGETFELPGIWFNASELHALLAARQLLANTQPGLLEKQLAPLQERIDKLLELHGDDGQIARRVRILAIGSRDAGDCFQIVAGATARRRRLQIRYRSRNGQSSERELSPQRLTHYRDNWYLDAFCHLRDDLRTFALDLIESARTLQQPTIDIDEQRLDAHYASAYGIFAGPAEHTAVLRFSAQRARWISREQWHPRQQGQQLDDGRYELRLPYGNPTELIMDILKYGPEVEVVAPEALREAVVEQLQQASAQYD